MKKLTLTFCALIALFAAAPAIFADGPEAVSGKKEVMQPAPPVCDFYRAHEWDLGIWGSYAFGSSTGQHNVPNEDPFDATDTDIDPTTTDIGTGFFGEQGADNPNERFNIGQVSANKLFGRDDSWGGGVDVKYFWSKYFGVGIEGLGLAAKTNFAGGGVLTFTARYPWGRFAPYVTGGLGFIDGGAAEYKFFNEKNVIGTVTSGFLPNGQPDTRPGFVVNEHEFWTVDPVSNHHVRALGQIGIGMEYRVTCHIGLMTDFTYNFVFGHDSADKIGTFTEQGSDITELFGTVVSSTPVINVANYLKPGQSSADQDFGMVRFGVTFSY
jgi:hypothetical protein